LKKRISEAAKAAGRSFSEEVTLRLTLSLSDDGGAQGFGDPETLALCRSLATSFEHIKRETGRPWFRHAWSFKQAEAAFKELFAYFRPIGEERYPADAPLLQNLRARGLDAEALEQMRSRLEQYPLGETAARLAVFLLESSSEGANTHLRDVAAILKAQLIAAGTAGEALADLLAGASAPSDTRVKP
jgi:superfamily I DNA/RNA helicase